MKRNILLKKLDAVKSETHDALQLIWDNTNKGQRSKLLKNEEIAKLLARYKVNTDG